MANGSSVLLSFVVLLLLASPVQANSGLPYTMFMLSLPFRTGILTGGAGWLVIVAVEALGLWQRESVSVKTAILTSAGMNLFSTLLGFLFMLPYAASGLWIFLLINSLLMGCIIAGVGQKLLDGKRFESKTWHMKLLFTLIGIVISASLFIIAGILNSGIGIQSSWTNSQINPVTYVIATLGLLGLNFLLTWISESYWLINRWKGKIPIQLSQTLFWINLRSYVYILLPTIMLNLLFQERV